MEGLDLHLITYNVGTFAPGAQTNLSALVPDSKPDLVLVGLQEVDSAPSTLVLESLSSGEDAWTQAARRSFSTLGYIKIRSIRLVGMVLSLFCLEKHVPYLRGLETQYTRLGLNGYWGNKGTVSIRFNIYGVSVCVLNSHLAAHDQYNQARIDGYNTTLGSHAFSTPETELVMYHDYVFWMGDLNFRLEVDSFTFQQIEQLVEQRQLQQLLAADQLSRARSSGQAFSELEEQLPPFPPTFKYKVGTSVFDGKRRPGWTDRILFKANRANYDTVDLALKQLSYASHPAFLDSDHKPVSAHFSVSVFSDKLAESLLLPAFRPVVRFHTEELYCSEDNVVVYTVDVKDWRLLQPWDWVAVYRAETSSLQDHVAFLWAPASPVTGDAFELSFDDTVFIRPGNYRLVYYSAQSRDILGFSAILPARIRDLAPELAVEATEEL